MLVEAVFSGLHSVGTLAATVFTAVRILLWALLVCTAWYEIVEKPFETELTKRTKQPKTMDLDPVELTKAALEQHQAAKTVEQLENNKQAPLTPPAHRTPNLPHLPHKSTIHATGSDMNDDESIDRWFFWEEENEAEKYAQQPRLPHEGNKMVAETPSPTVGYAKATQSLTTVPIGTRPAVTVTALEEGKRRHREEEVKKPFVTRKLEEMFVSPYKDKYEHTAYFLYRGINRAGIRLETSTNSLTKELDGSIRDAGVEAVNRVEVVMRRYLKFFGAVVLLTIVLLPLPSVHISLGVA